MTRIAINEAKAAPTVAAAAAELLAMIDAATAPILAAYPEGERLSWDAKETEAAGFMAAADPAPADYPLLRGEVAAESAIATDAVTLEQLTAKAETVLWMAAQWRALVSRLAGLRKRYMADLASATTSDARRAVIEAARAEVAG